ncbi:RNA polymerase sigma factor [Caldalkalibacillus mannanilyticus]|uniref:RNA polymerase sigma factor n=1 Tax=Caldalkalibacillus mannanilyticus TaxID=1418 RepID=UPI00131F3F3B|nr:RNA polymerase sigma factor [Caldalkalibacillus mannanilyticus]
MDQISASEKTQYLYHQYCDDLYRFFIFMVGSSEVAEDLLQETFLNVYTSIRSFEGRATEKTWLFRIARNIAVDWIRKKRSFRWIVEALTATIKSSEPQPLHFIELNESEAELYRALAKLSDKYRTVIYLRKIKEFSIAETAAIMQCTEGRVKTDLYRGLQKLKDLLEEEGYIHEPL